MSKSISSDFLTDIEQMRLKYSQDQEVWDLLDEVEALREVVRLFEVTHFIQEFEQEETHMAFFAKDCALEITPAQAAAVRRALGEDDQ